MRKVLFCIAYYCIHEGAVLRCAAAAEAGGGMWWENDNETESNDMQGGRRVLQELAHRVCESERERGQER